VKIPSLCLLPSVLTVVRTLAVKIPSPFACCCVGSESCLCKTCLRYLTEPVACSLISRKQSCVNLASQQKQLQSSSDADFPAKIAVWLNFHFQYCGVGAFCALSNHSVTKVVTEVVTKVVAEVVTKSGYGRSYESGRGSGYGSLLTALQ